MERYLGKTLRYAFQYGTGEKKVMNTINSDAKKYGIPIQVSQSEARKFLALCNEKMPSVKGVFHAEVKEALIKNNRVLISPILPFGPPTGRRRQFLDRFDDDLLRQAYAQIPQSIPPDHIRRCYIFDIQPKLKTLHAEEELLLCGESHDALLFKSRLGFRDTAKELIKTSLETPIDFTQCTLSRGNIKIPVEIKVGPNYKDMEKV